MESPEPGILHNLSLDGALISVQRTLKNNTHIELIVPPNKVEGKPTHIVGTVLRDAGGEADGSFTARQRHIDALQKAQHALNQGRLQLTENSAGELLAEDLRLAQDHLGEITGKVTPDDLLGHIFSSFCIGK